MEQLFLTSLVGNSIYIYKYVCIYIYIYIYIFIPTKGHGHPPTTVVVANVPIIRHPAHAGMTRGPIHHLLTLIMVRSCWKVHPQSHD